MEKMENVVTAEQFDDLFEKYVESGFNDIAEVIDSVFSYDELKEMVKAKIINNKCSFYDTAEILGGDDFYEDYKIEPVVEILKMNGLEINYDYDRNRCKDIYDFAAEKDEEELFSEIKILANFHDMDLSLTKIAKIAEDLLSLNLEG